ncbi:hypothetical protein AVEN_203412-1 [Araneus ventricosus]|uniref:Uncharacterized protein n=1 Tax=Araneus ventricosus TaxID=182803 RepID=A0A4Y2I9W7_ARAVE|nr:hypothetical protein AVEN_203412-1 [Araneus ventricosus]
MGRKVGYPIGANFHHSTTFELPDHKCGNALGVGDADLTKNVGATGESSVCSLVHRDKLRYSSTTKLSVTVWKGTIVLTNYSGLVYVIYGNRLCSP